MNCSVCHKPLTDESRYCINCGAPQNNGALITESDTAVMRQLAAANLHRIRGDWAEAEFLCTEVLRADPENISAHSLLGDVFRDQGRLDDACQWYQLALDLDPNSRADRLKLDRLNEERRQKSLEIISHNLLSATPGVGTGKLAGVSPVIWIRGLTAVSAALLLILVLVVIIFKSRIQQPAANSSLPNHASTIPSTATTSPIIPVGPSSTDIPTNTSPPTMQNAPVQSASAPPNEAANRPESAVAEENQALLLGLNQMLTSSGLGKAAGIQIYPSLGVVEVSLGVWDNWPNMTMQGNWQSWFYPMVRTAVLRSALYSAKYVFQDYPRAQIVQITASTWLPTTAPQTGATSTSNVPFTKKVVFLESLPRGVTGQDIASLNEAQLEQLAGKSAIWDPALKPSAPAASSSP